MDDPWKQLPRAAAIVYVGVLAAGTGRPARAEQEPAAAPSDSSPLTDHVPEAAPTCGPQCHNGGDEVLTPIEPEPELEEEHLPIAPTCGAGCHGGDGYYEHLEGPPPLPPESKKGCAVESVGDERALGLLGLGLLAGVAMRRRRESQ